MYTGILLRTDIHTNFDTVDPLVTREIAISPSGLGVGIDRGSGVESFWLNYGVLSKIGTVAVDGSITPGFKTSDIPITFDAGSWLTDANGIKVNNNLLHNSLSYISGVSSTSITFTDKGGFPSYTSLVLADLATVSSPAPILSGPSPTEVTTDLDNTVIEAEDGTVIGTGDAPTVVLSPAQNSTDRIYAYTIDTHKNKSIRTSILIP